MKVMHPYFVSSTVCYLRTILIDWLSCQFTLIYYYCYLHPIHLACTMHVLYGHANKPEHCISVPQGLVTP